MDLSVQKMQPPASVQGKSAAKKTAPASSEEAVDDVMLENAVNFHRGNNGYESDDSDEQNAPDDRKQRRKNRQLLSGEDLSELTMSVEVLQQDYHSADGLMQVRAYQSHAPEPKDEDDLPHFEVNI